MLDDDMQSIIAEELELSGADELELFEEVGQAIEEDEPRMPTSWYRCAVRILEPCGRRATATPLSGTSFDRQPGCVNATHLSVRGC